MASSSFHSPTLPLILPLELELFAVIIFFSCRGAAVQRMGKCMTVTQEDSLSYN